MLLNSYALLPQASCVRQVNKNTTSNRQSNTHRVQLCSFFVIKQFLQFIFRGGRCFVLCTTTYKAAYFFRLCACQLTDKQGPLGAETDSRPLVKLYRLRSRLSIETPTSIKESVTAPSVSKALLTRLKHHLVAN